MVISGMSLTSLRVRRTYENNLHLDRSNHLYPAYQDGTYFSPYLNLQYALDFGILSNKVLVLQEGTHSMRETFVDTLEMITRFGSSTVVRQGVQTYNLPVHSALTQ